MQVDRQRAITRVCFDREPSRQDLDALGAGDKWLLYRQMVRDRLIRVAGNALPKTKKAVGGRAFEGLAGEWLAKGPPNTPYLREIIDGFMEVALPLLGEQTKAPWAGDLARWEHAKWSVAYDAATMPTATAEFHFDLVPVMTPALRKLDVEYAVHRDPNADGSYAKEPTHLCVFRSKTNQAATWHLKPIASALLDRWRTGEQTVTESVQQEFAARNEELTQGFVEDLSGLLADFIDRGAILGSRAAE